MWINNYPEMIAESYEELLCRFPTAPIPRNRASSPYATPTTRTFPPGSRSQPRSTRSPTTATRSRTSPVRPEISGFATSAYAAARPRTASAAWLRPWGAPRPRAVTPRICPNTSSSAPTHPCSGRTWSTGARCSRLYPPCGDALLVGRAYSGSHNDRSDRGYGLYGPASYGYIKP